MLSEVNQRDRDAWHALGEAISSQLHRELRTAPIGQRIEELLDLQVDLITSIPLSAAERVQELSLEAVSSGTRAREIAQQIGRSAEVTAARATLIARTEVGRASTVFTQARCEAIGLTHYIWRTAHDADVRPGHRAMEGKVCEWAEPPEVNEGGRIMRFHPGAIWNCFPGSTKVSLTNGCHQLWRTWYEGALVCIEHEMGFLELTPNHPVLTGRGWVAAKDIDAGDYLFQSVSDHLLALNDDKHEGQPTFAEIFVALESVLDRKSHSGLLFDFHGDRPHSDVDAIVADHLLPGHGVSPLFKGIGDFAFTRANGVVEDLWIGRRSSHVVESSLACRRNDTRSVFEAHRLHTNDVCLTPSTALYAMSIENSSNYQSSASKLDRESQLARASNVLTNNRAFRKVFASVMSRGNSMSDFDTASAEMLAENIRTDADLICDRFYGRAGSYKPIRVLDKMQRSFRDHVYTMQTANGWFTVTRAGIVTKNCRCFPEPVIVDPYERSSARRRA